MVVVCAWCEAERQPAALREKEPKDSPISTYGICARHRARFLALLYEDVTVGGSGAGS